MLVRLTERLRWRWLAFLLGMREFRWDCTWVDPLRVNYTLTRLDYAYDHGREWAHRLTLRIFDN